MGRKRTFSAFYNPLETIKDFPWPKMAIYGKTCFMGSRKLFRKAGFGKNRPFLRPMKTFWAQKRVF
jgi:hypothetical protein